MAGPGRGNAGRAGRSHDTLNGARGDLYGLSDVFAGRRDAVDRIFVEFYDLPDETGDPAH
jgi:hypothetical protein